VLSFEEFKRDPKVSYWAGTLAPSTRREYVYRLYQYFRWLWSVKRVSKTPEQFFQEHVENMFASKPTDLDAKRRNRLILEEYVGLNGPLADAQNAYRRHVARVVKSFYLKNDCPLLGEVRIVLKPDKAVKKVHQVGLKEAAEYRAIAKLRREGWVCVRSAQSHGPADVIAAKNGRILLIQVKAGKARTGGEEAQRLKEWAAVFNATAQVWTFRGRKLTVQTLA
jgi:Holliday junction resolvase